MSHFYSIENGATAKDCILSTGDCSPTRLSVLENIVSFGLEAACDNPRRCVKHANIFEVKPGEYFASVGGCGWRLLVGVESVVIAALRSDQSRGGLDFSNNLRFRSDHFNLRHDSERWSLQIEISAVNHG